MSWRDRLVEYVAGDLIRARVTEVETRAEERIKEAFTAGRGLTPDDRKNIEQGFRRLSQADGHTLPRRDLQPLAQEWMLRLVHWLWEANPLGKWIIETTVDFVLGEGAQVESDVPEIDRVIQAFWLDPVNQLHRRLDSFTREYGLNGELCLPAAVNEFDGRVRLAYVDPLEIAQVITDPNNVMLQLSVVLKARAGERERVLKIIREDTSRVSPYEGLMMAALPGERDPVLNVGYDGSCFLFQTNKLSNGRRGRSDLLASIDWLDGYDAYLFDSMDAAQLFNSFVYDATLEGYNETQIQEWLAKYQASIKRNGVFAHNEKVKLQAVTPDLKALDKDAFARLFRGHVLGSHSFPEHWYGLAGEVNLASAKEMGLPPVKRLTRRQKELRYLIHDLVRFQLHQAIRVGELQRETVVGKVAGDGSSTGTRKPTDQAFSIILPELSMRDQASTVAAVTSLVAALTQAKAEGWVRPQTAAKVFANLLSQLGMEINAEEEYTPGAGPTGEALRDYEQLPRLLAQLKRQGNGNGDNVGEPKRTTPVGGSVAT